MSSEIREAVIRLMPRILARRARLSHAMIDRLTLDETRLEAMAVGLEAIAALPDPSALIIGRMGQAKWLTNYTALNSARRHWHYL